MRPTRTLVAALATAATVLLAPAAASASPAPSASTTATGTARTSSGTTTDQQHLDIAWQLAPGEYACGVIATSTDAQVSTPVSPSTTSATLDLPATGGTAITVELRWAAPAVQPARPEDACASPSGTTTTVTAATYSPPPPPPPSEPTPTTPTAPAPGPTTTNASTTPATTTAAPDTSSLEARIKALEDAIAQLTDRVARVEKAVDAAWLAYEDALEGGADDATAAGIARGTALNAIYGLGAFATTAP